MRLISKIGSLFSAGVPLEQTTAIQAYSPLVLPTRCRIAGVLFGIAAVIGVLVGHGTSTASAAKPNKFKLTITVTYANGQRVPSAIVTVTVVDTRQQDMPGANVTITPPGGFGRCS